MRQTSSRRSVPDPEGPIFVLAAECLVPTSPAPPELSRLELVAMLFTVWAKRIA